MLRRCCQACISALVILTAWTSFGPRNVSAAPQQQVRIGVLANRGIEKCREDWGGMIRQLQVALPDMNFVLVPLTFDNVAAATANAAVDFAVVNPAIYVNLEVKHDAIRIATLINQTVGKSSARFGGVFFTPAKSTAVQNFSQIKGKHLAATSPTSFGGWLLGRYTLLQNGIDPDKDLASLHFYESHDQVVLQVLEGYPEVGTVRTDTLERMAASGKIHMEDLRILTPQDFKQDSSFPFVYSTQLEPEWPFVKLKHTPDTLARSVAASLLLMAAPADNATANGTQWTVPLPYERIRDIMKVMRVPPFENYGQVNFIDFIGQHLKMAIITFLLVLSLLASLVYFRMLSRRLQMAMQKLQAAEIELTRQANTDGLTNLINRKRFNEIIGPSGFPVGI